MTITFQHPYGSPTLTLTLPDPRHNDSQDNDTSLTNGISPEGTVYTYRKATRTKLIYDFDQITDTNKAAILAFMTTTAGDWIKLTDWNLDVWKIKIMSNPLRFTETRGAQACRFRRLRLEIEGTKI